MNSPTTHLTLRERSHRPRVPEAPTRMADGPRVRTVALDAGYGDAPVVRGLDLYVGAGEVVALLGPNGAGKTTALSTIAGVLPPLGGEVHLDGQLVTDGLEERARRGLGLLSDDRSVFRELTVADNLRLGGGDPGEAVGLFPALRPLLRRQAGLLSGGEQQMLGLGRAMARKPRILLVDELSLGLAPIIIKELLLSIRRIADSGTAVLLVEQQVRLVLEVCDRAYVLRRGIVTLTATAKELRADIGQVENSYLSGND